MKVAGFSFIRNAIKYDYPIVEAITSVLPLCDHFYIAVGRSDDDTLQLIKNINPDKISILETQWDDSIREGGKVLAVETNKAFDMVPASFDWCFYIQGDEVLHEKYYPAIRSSMLSYKDNSSVEGLLFNYLHFYGSYDYYANSRKWYRHEIRIIKNDKTIRSYKDAMGFRKNGRKLNVKAIDAYIYHYGWVKDPVKQLEKMKNFNKLWHSDEKVREIVGDKSSFDYSNIDSLRRFEGSHPQVMMQRVKSSNWKFSYNPEYSNPSLKLKILAWFEKHTGYRIGEYRNYRKV